MRGGTDSPAREKGSSRPRRGRLSGGGPPGGRMLFALVIGAVAFVFLPAGVYLPLRFVPFPRLETFLERPYSTVVTDRKGRRLASLPREGGSRREYVPLGKIPSEVVEVFLASEDGRFFYHPGVDGIAAVRSLFDAARARRVVSGASTVTMQLAGMITPRDRDFAGKIREVIDAVRIETRLSKSEILELWLNSLPFGGPAEGIQSGSLSIFGKPVRDLTVPEALLLAVVPRRPRDLNPSYNPEAAVRAALVTAGRYPLPVGEEELFRAAARAARGDASLTTKHSYLGRPAGYSVEDREAPHFLEAVKRTAEPGMIRTSLDLEIQRPLKELLRYALEGHESHRISHAAAVVLDTRTGEILAYLGSPHYSSGREGSMIDAVRVSRQPGSCLKPFLYAFALEEGYEPWNILPDEPLDFGGREVYTPTDFDNLYRGPVRFRVALASSLNIPAVYLLDQLGVERFAGFLTSAGFPGGPAEIARSGLGLALGNREVNLLDLTRAFSIFPRGGTLPELSYLPPDGVEDGPGEEEQGDKGAVRSAGGERIVSRYTAGVICSILSDDSARIPGFGSVRLFETPFPAIFKTGTSNQFQDIWALGATPRYTVGVWMGNLTGETVIGRAGSSIPLNVVRELLLYLHGGDGESLPEPPGAALVEICAATGRIAGEECPAAVKEYTRNLPPRCTVDHGPGRAGPAGADPGTGGVAIIRPADGAVYFYDDSEPEEIQAVRIEFRGGQGSAEISVNGRDGRVLSPGEDSWYLPLSRGVWTIAVSRGGHTDSITIEVR